jgi:hypothetical protein
MADWSMRFSTICQQADNSDFAGYAEVFNAILDGNQKHAQEGLTAIAKGHRNQSKRGGVFRDTEDEVLCVWGIGMANLARRRGLSVTRVAPLIPQELLV